MHVHANHQRQAGRDHERRGGRSPRTLHERGLQGGPHPHTIAGIAVSLKEAKSEEFVQYQRQVFLLIKLGCKKYSSSL